MKQYKLVAWPDLPVHFHRTAYRRMLHRMSQRYVGLEQLLQDSGLGRPAVVQFLDLLAERRSLAERERLGEIEVRPSSFNPLAWLRRTWAEAGRA